ncbi:ribonuclease H-like domain-containing protein [Rhizophagus clarus]|uniref:ribonuclease H n=1 Tax=Rhizophagus clarus TaxID=94130 RepID=A0A8H3LZU2_9GLOM|nr:ribonuclease H-like domain-containing protein [Rhizophagus clarus]
MRISVMAYMDDTIYLDHSVARVQESINIADDFYRLHNIEVNGPITDYIAINTAEERDKCKVLIGFDRKIIKDNIENFLCPLRSKAISVGQIEYLVNRILIPRCAYIGQLTNFSESEWDSLFRSVLKVVKQKCGFASSMPTSTVLHHNIININTPWNIFLEQQMNNLCNTLNSTSLAHTAIRIRLQTAQLRLGIPKSILTFDIGYLKSNVRLGQQNNSLNTMIRERMMGIEIAQSSKDQLEWSIEGGKHTICTFLYEIVSRLVGPSLSNCKGIQREAEWLHAYLDTVTVKSKIKKKDLLLILPRDVEEAPSLGLIHNKGKADNKGRFDIKKAIMMADDTLVTKKLIIRQYKTTKSICQNWEYICNFKDKEVIDERGNLWDISIRTLEIVIVGYDVWIEKWLNDSPLQESLMRTKTALQEGWDEPRANRRLEIYTDGSLTKTRDPLDREFKIAASIRDWPSSTRTEICAILIALMAVPELAQVIIYTDSQCAIDDITSWNKKSVWAKAKMTNHCILFRIDQIVKEKRINLEVIKVKGHSNITGNEEADKLAAEGSNSNLRFTYRIDYSSQDFRYILTFDGVLIEQSLRKFIHRLLNTYNVTEWSLLQCNRELCHTNTRQVAWEMLYKCLPIGSILAQRRSDLYKQYRCLACQNDKVEDWEHLLDYRGYDEAWNSIHEKLTLEFKIIGQKELKDDIAITTRLNSAITELLDRWANFAKFREFVKLSMEVKCDRAWLFALKKTLRITENEAIGLYVHFLFRFIVLFREIIWKPRCDRTIAWERSAAITKQQKH